MFFPQHLILNVKRLKNVMSSPSVSTRSCIKIIAILPNIGDHGLKTMIGDAISRFYDNVFYKHLDIQKKTFLLRNYRFDMSFLHFL